MSLWRDMGRVQLQLYPLLTLTLNEGWMINLVHRPFYSQGKNTQDALNTRLGGSQRPSGLLVKKKISSPCRGSNPGSFMLYPDLYIRYIIPPWYFIVRFRMFLSSFGWWYINVTCCEASFFSCPLPRFWSPRCCFSAGKIKKNLEDCRFQTEKYVKTLAEIRFKVHVTRLYGQEIRNPILCMLKLRRHYENVPYQSYTHDVFSLED
jgi:hypothetical protein